MANPLKNIVIGAFGAAVIAAVGVFLLAAPPSVSEIPAVSKTSAGPASFASRDWHILDGKRFAGELGFKGKPAHAKDVWIFDAGTFRSVECEKCGYPRGPFRAMRKDGHVSFVAETLCNLTGATIIWEGTVSPAGEIEGTFTWIKKRWYRKMTKVFWFKGRLEPRQSADGR